MAWVLVLAPRQDLVAGYELFAFGMDTAGYHTGSVSPNS